jgi:hypothetical protein
MCLRRVRVDGRTVAAALVHVSTPLRRLRLRRKISAWASGSPAGDRRVAACFGRWRAFPLRSPPRRQTVQRPHLRDRPAF